MNALEPVGDGWRRGSIGPAFGDHSQRRHGWVRLTAEGWAEFIGEYDLHIPPEAPLVEAYSPGTCLAVVFEWEWRE